jgi:hypothetical protein
MNRQGIDRCIDHVYYQGMGNKTALDGREICSAEAPT